MTHDEFMKIIKSAKIKGITADLRGADMRRASLSEADLSRADLSGADMRRASLCGTCLDPLAPMPSITDDQILNLGLTLDTVDDRQIVRGWRTAVSQVVLGHEYVWGWYGAPVFSVSDTTTCHPGIYLAGREWLEREYPGAELVRVWCYRDEMIVVDDKARAKLICVEG